MRHWWFETPSLSLWRQRIFFNEWITTGWHGMVIDTRKSLYRNTYVMITHNGSLSEPILANTVPTNQGGCVILQIMRLQAKYQKDQIKTEGAHMIWKKNDGRAGGWRTDERGMVQYRKGSVDYVSNKDFNNFTLPFFFNKDYACFPRNWNWSTIS